MALRVVALALLFGGYGTLVSVGADAGDDPIGCDVRRRMPTETTAYGVIRDYIHANAIVDRAHADRLKAQERIRDSLSNFFAAVEREARAAECAAKIVEPFDAGLASNYREDAQYTRQFREIVTKMLEVDIYTAEGWTKWKILMANIMADRKVAEEDRWKDRHDLTDVRAAIAASDPKCLAPGQRTCPRNRLAITHEERTRLIAAITSSGESKFTRLVEALEEPTPAWMTS